MRSGVSACLSLIAIVALQIACTKPAPPVNVYRMGEKVQVGPLIYNVFEARWQSKIGEGSLTRTPAHRFLVLHASIVNSGAETIAVPSFKLADDSGQIYNESVEGQDIPLWLGMIRNLKPADTLEGNVLFDVEAKSYRLKLDDGSESGKIVMVELPLQFDTGKPIIPSDIERSAQ